MTPFLCPVCENSFKEVDGSLVCASGHCFDIARQKYVNFVITSPPSKAIYGPEMLQARESFLNEGYFDPIIHMLSCFIQDQGVSGSCRTTIVDAGCGTGFYLRRISEELVNSDLIVNKVGIDISKHAVKIAASKDPEGSYAVMDLLKHINLQSSSVDYILSIFSPRNAQEFSRILRKNSGRLVVVMAGEDHIHELRSKLNLLDVEKDKPSRVKESLSDYFHLESEFEIRSVLDLKQESVVNLLEMSPNFFHKEKQDWSPILEKKRWNVTLHAKTMVFTSL